MLGRAHEGVVVLKVRLLRAHLESLATQNGWLASSKYSHLTYRANVRLNLLSISDTSNTCNAAHIEHNTEMLQCRFCRKTFSKDKAGNIKFFCNCQHFFQEQKQQCSSLYLNTFQPQPVKPFVPIEDQNINFHKKKKNWLNNSPKLGTTIFLANIIQTEKKIVLSERTSFMLWIWWWIFSRRTRYVEWTQNKIQCPRFIMKEHFTQCNERVHEASATQTILITKISSLLVFVVSLIIGKIQNIALSFMMLLHTSSKYCFITWNDIAHYLLYITSQSKHWEMWTHYLNNFKLI